MCVHHVDGKKSLQKVNSASFFVALVFALELYIHRMLFVSYPSFIESKSATIIILISLRYLCISIQVVMRPLKAGHRILNGDTALILAIG